MSRPVKVVTFDLWDTLILDDSDELERAAAGLRPKTEARLDLIATALDESGQQVAKDKLYTAARAVEVVGHWVWHQLHVNWSVRQRLEAVLTTLELSLSAESLEKLVRAWEEMELEPMPALVPGAKEVLGELARSYSLAVVSDAIVSPGRVLRLMLDRYGLLDYFAAFSFSDEVGRSKPDRAMFAHIGEVLHEDLTTMVHVGDRQHNDILGAQRAGMRAVLFVGANERSLCDNSADAVCRSLSELPAVLASLAGGA